MLSRNALIILCSLSTATAKVSFNNDIRPLLSNTCLRCHGPDENERKANLRLDTHEGATAEHDSIRAVVPGNIEASELIYRITTEDPDDLMPPPKAGKRFTAEQIALFKQWIKEGANYEKHWAYIPINRPAVPVEQNSSWSKGVIDRFVMARLEMEDVSVSTEIIFFSLSFVKINIFLMVTIIHHNIFYHTGKRFHVLP